MITNHFRIADKVVSVSSNYENFHINSSDYLTDAPADYALTVTQADIEYEREKTAREDALQGIPARHYSDGDLEGLAVYRKIAEKMADYDTVLFHGSAVAADGAGYLFAAGSGTGKSTHTRLWRAYFGDRAVMINDDKPLIRIAGTITVFGTPYNGKHRLGTNTSAPLKAICFLSRSAENHIVPVAAEEAYPQLLQHVYRPADLQKMKKILDLMDLLSDGVKFYQLGCNMDLSAAKVAFEGMQ